MALGEINGDAPTEEQIEADVAVVGAGPAGIVIALELARTNHRVVLLDSGGTNFDQAAQDLGETVGEDPCHVEMSLATRRQLGGASNIWGGRCVPFDPIDFEPRPLVGTTRWPVGYEELASYLQRACDWCRCGRAVFDAHQLPRLATRAIVPAFLDGEVCASALERWSLPTNFARTYRHALECAPSLRLETGLTCTEIVPRAYNTGRWRVDHLAARRGDGRSVAIRATRYVIAAGGLETTRLLLASRREHPTGIGNHSNHLGHWYMAHVESRVARVHFTTAPESTIYAHERDDDGVYVRRRFTLAPETQIAERLPNVAMWLVNPELGDASHRSGVLSFVYLALSSPVGGRFVAEGIRRAHLKTRRPATARAHASNIARGLGPAVAFAVRFGYQRFVRSGRKVPGFFVQSKTNVYPLLYHGEHLPHWQSRVELSDQRDFCGVPRLRTKLHFDDDDVAAVRRTHDVLDRALRRQGLGHVEFLYDDVEEAVRGQLFGGYHQCGTTRMSATPDAGVVDSNLAVHGFDDLFIASSSTFPTSSQANSTFTLVAFALRLADHLAIKSRDPCPTLALSS